MQTTAPAPGWRSGLSKLLFADVKKGSIQPREGCRDRVWLNRPIDDFGKRNQNRNQTTCASESFCCERTKNYLDRTGVLRREERGKVL